MGICRHLASLLILGISLLGCNRIKELAGSEGHAPNAPPDELRKAVLDARFAQAQAEDSAKAAQDAQAEIEMTVFRMKEELRQQNERINKLLASRGFRLDIDQAAETQSHPEPSHPVSNSKAPRTAREGVGKETTHHDLAKRARKGGATSNFMASNSMAPKANAFSANPEKDLFEDFNTRGTAEVPTEPPRPKRAPASISPPTTTFFGKPSRESKAQLEQRFKQALRLFETKDEEEKVQMVILEPDGSKKRRELRIQRAADGGAQRMLARVVKPADLRGSSVLLVTTKEADQQWVYLPSSKQTRKVIVANQKGYILGSELRYEDFNPSVIRRSNVSLLRSEIIENKKYDVFQVQIPTGSSPYESALVWIDPKSEMPIQIEYYLAGEKVKTIEFSNYYRVGKIWRPGRIAVQNLKNNRGTIIDISDVKINSGLSSEDLSVSALSRAW
ncbi:MAG: hypothetical protein C5B49_05690 [Bdellovibrio sp.]|nr:MAG: hypothetical protein C5B49_05690 [Bdellovibrio sp.]